MQGIARSSGRPRMPKVSRQTQFPEAPRGFPNPRKKPIHLSGPGEPPPGFVGQQTTRSEWPVFWALMKELGPPGEIWSYQAETSDGVRIDFVVWDREPRLAIRVQTARYHIATSSRIHLYDHTQREILEAIGYQVIDVYEEDYIEDDSGQAVREIVKDALAGIERPNPVAWGTSRARPI